MLSFDEARLMTELGLDRKSSVGRGHWARIHYICTGYLTFAHDRALKATSGTVTMGRGSDDLFALWRHRASECERKFDVCRHVLLHSLNRLIASNETFFLKKAGLLSLLL